MADMLNVTCPCCGGSLKFDTSLQKVKCEFCDTEFEVSDLQALDEDIKNTPEESAEWSEDNLEEFTEDETNGMSSMFCETCGGEVIVDANTTSTRCPYCNNPVLVAKRLTGGLKPNYVIPFSVEKDAATVNLAKFLKGKVLLPGPFKKENKVEDISGLYVPYWIFDADVNGHAVFKGEKHRSWSDSNYTYHETRYYRLVRAGEIAFDHVPVDASQKMPDDLMESIEPFDFNGAKPFSAAYITGHCADKYDVDKEETFKRANVRINEGTVDALRATIHGYSGVALKESRINLYNNKASYAYYPVWTLNTKYREKDFKFAMNGQTGKLVGNLPMSKPKFIIWLISLLIIGAAAGFGIMFGIMNGDEYQMIASVIGAVVVGLGLSLGVTTALRHQLKPVKFQHGAKNYVRENSFHLNTSRDIFLYRTVRKTRKAQNKK